jgi:hypothetical protein
MPSAPRVCQIAMCTDDLPRTIRLYSEAFGFADAGGRLLRDRSALRGREKSDIY